METWNTQAVWSTLHTLYGIAKCTTYQAGSTLLQGNLTISPENHASTLWLLSNTHLIYTQLQNKLSIIALSIITKNTLS